MSDSPTCHNCYSSDLYEFDEYRSLHRVTSDCKAWAPGGSLVLCKTCGLLQAIVNPKWEDECNQIYRDYSIYFQSDGVEQAVFDADTGRPMTRSEKLVKNLFGSHQLPKSGRLLDVGCGNGGFLKVCSTYLPGWRLAGAELSKKNKDVVLSIPGVEDFYTMNPEDIPGSFDVVSMLHLLEHVPHPTKFLQAMASKLSEGGYLFVQVPTPEKNPFELLIADHCSHFGADSLQAAARSAGLHIASKELDWIPKELSLIATSQPGERDSKEKPEGEISEQIAKTSNDLRWLKSFAEQAKIEAQEKPVGIFGTSIAANWLTATIGEKSVAFYVDEDPSRAGKTHLDKPIVFPQEVSSSTKVFLPIAPEVSKSIQKRLAHLPIDMVTVS